MRVALNNVPAILGGYLEQVLLPKTTLKTEKAIIGVALFIIAKKGTEIIQNPALVEKLRAFGAIDSKNTIDMDFLKDLALFTLEKTDNKFDFSTRIPLIKTELSYSFDKADVEAIYQLAQSVAE